MKKFLTFVLAIVISFVPGIFGGFFSPIIPGVNDWYHGLAQSVLTPNGWVFSIAWLILYTLLGIALYLIMRSGKTRQNKATAYTLFIVQMILNTLWSYLFFGLHMVGWAMICVVALVGVAFWMAIAFKPISRVASYLVWPYVAWLIFAAYLNGTILILN